MRNKGKNSKKSGKIKKRAVEEAVAQNQDNITGGIKPIDEEISTDYDDLHDDESDDLNRKEDPPITSSQSNKKRKIKKSDKNVEEIEDYLS